MRRYKDLRARWALLLLPGLLLAGCDRGLSENTVAEAGDFQLEVEEAARIIASAPTIPADSEIVGAIVEIWMDVVLLAQAVNDEGGVEQLDLSPIVEMHREQELVMRLRERVIADPEVSEEELRTIYEAEDHGVEVQARHILLRLEEGVNTAERDSVRARAEELHARVQAGESFEELAAEHSEDPGSAASGGDLGYFERGDMVPPFEEAAFELEPGEVSDIVETDFGFHIIRVDERRVTPFEELADQLRSQTVAEMTAEAESFYISQLEGPANVEIAEDAAQQVRDLVAEADAPLRGRRAGTALATYEGGTYTLGDIQRFILSQPRQIRQQIEAVPDEQIEQFVRDLTRDRLLVADAEERGLDLDSSELETLRSEIQNEYAEFAEVLQVTSIEPEEGEALHDAIDRRSKEIVTEVVRGERELVMFGPLSLPLRQQYTTRVSDAAFERVASRVEELREEGSDPAPPSTGPPAQRPESGDAVDPDSGS